MGFGLSIILFDLGLFLGDREEMPRFEVICNFGQYQIHDHILLICQVVLEIASS